MAVKDKISGAQFAIKKIEEPFKNKVVAKRTLRELRILRLFDHGNFMRNERIFLPKSREEFSDM